MVNVYAVTCKNCRDIEVWRAEDGNGKGQNYTGGDRKWVARKLFEMPGKWMASCRLINELKTCKGCKEIESAIDLYIESEGA